MFKTINRTFILSTAKVIEIIDEAQRRRVKVIGLHIHIRIVNLLNYIKIFFL
jgi:hypothetical protein